MSRGEKTLERMRRTKTGWRPADFERVYAAHGFERKDGSNHTVYKHPRYKHLWTTVTKSYPMSKAYAEDAVRLVDELEQLERTGDSDEPDRH